LLFAARPIHSAISAATTLLATLSNLATTISLEAPPVTLAITKATNPATRIQATPALPSTLATALEPMVGVLAGLGIALVILPTALSDRLTYPATKPATACNLTTATQATLVTTQASPATLAISQATQASPATLAISQATQATNHTMTKATQVLPATLAPTLEPMVGVLADLVIVPTSIPVTNLNPLTSPATNPATKHNLATPTPTTLGTNQAYPAALLTPQMSQATNPSTINTLANPAIEQNFATAPDTMTTQLRNHSVRHPVRHPVSPIAVESP
jgi:hypothetical protein